MACFWWCMKVISRIIVTPVTVPSGHPLGSVLVFNIANMEISVCIRLNFNICLRDELSWILFGYKK